MKRSGLRPKAGMTALQFWAGFSSAGRLAPAPVPSNAELTLEHGREPSAEQIGAREMATVRPARSA